MRLRPSQVTPPASLPLDWLADVKGHLRLDADDERDRIMDVLVPAAATWAETSTGRALITQTWKVSADYFPGEVITLPKPPLQTVKSVKYYDLAGVLQTLSPSVYTVDAPAGEKALPGRIYPVYGQYWPLARAQRNAVVIEFDCGYGDDATAVPGLLRAAMLLVVAELFERREVAVAGTIINEVPLSASVLAGQFLSESC